MERSLRKRNTRWQAFYEINRYAKIDFVGSVSFNRCILPTGLKKDSSLLDYLKLGAVALTCAGLFLNFGKLPFALPVKLIAHGVTILAVILFFIVEYRSRNEAVGAS